MQILRYLKKVVSIIAFTLVSGNAIAINPQEVDLLKNTLTSVLPEQWRLEEVNNPEKAWWMLYNKNEFIELRLVGPLMSGHRYKYQSGETKDILFRNEGIYLWITSSSFDDGWTLWRRFQYRLTITYTKLPDIIPTKFGLKIYALPGWVAEKLPSESFMAESRMIYESGGKKGSWTKWKADITKAVK